MRLTKAARELLAGGAWPGTCAELENTVFRMVLAGVAGVPRGAPVVVKPAHLGVDVAAAAEPAPREDDAERATPAAAAPLNEQVDAFQRGLIERAVAQHDGNWVAAARSLGMHRSNLHHSRSGSGCAEANGNGEGPLSRRKLRVEYPRPRAPPPTPASSRRLSPCSNASRTSVST